MLLQTTRTAGLVGSAVGVMVGCLIGMFPLLFMPDSEVVEAVKRKEKVTGRPALRIAPLFSIAPAIHSSCPAYALPVVLDIDSSRMRRPSTDRLDSDSSLSRSELDHGATNAPLVLLIGCGGDRIAFHTIDFELYLAAGM